MFLWTNAKKKVITFAHSIDTITTKLLTLVLFVTTIPLMAVANFSTDIINQSMFDSARNELNYTIKLTNQAYKSDMAKLKTLGITTIRQALSSRTKGACNTTLISALHNLKRDAEITSGIIINKESKIIASTDNIASINGNLMKLANIAFSGEQILSSELITQKDIKTFSKKPSNMWGLAKVAVLPISYPAGKVEGVVILIKKSRDDNFIPDMVKEATGSTVSFYDLAANSLKPIATNLIIYNARYIDSLLDQSLADQLRSNHSAFIKVQQPTGTEIGRYEPVTNYFGKTVGAIYVGIPEYKFVAPGSKNVSLISFISVISLVVAIGIAAFFARTITTPILKLVSAAKYIATGDLNQRVRMKGHDEIAQLSGNFNLMADNLQKQEQLRDNFIATLTHDLKVPMLAENQTISYFLNKDYGPITEEQKEVLELIKSTNNSSLEMVSTLLEVYRYDAGNVHLIRNDFDIIKLFRQSIDEIKSLAEDKKINISLITEEDKIMVNADEREIKRVLHNLISNAIYNGIHRGHIHCHITSISGRTQSAYYSPKNNEIYSTLKNKINISNSVLISVKDDGIGIHREDMPYLFKRFSLNKGRKPAGTGLGLYYSYQVINMHNAHIWAESSERRGSSFKFILPLSTKEA